MRSHLANKVTVWWYGTFDNSFLLISHSFLLPFLSLYILLWTLGAEDRLIAADICQSIATVLKTFPTHTVITEKACFAMCNLAVNNRNMEKKEKMGIAGVHEEIVHTLSRIQTR